MRATATPVQHLLIAVKRLGKSRERHAEGWAVTAWQCSEVDNSAYYQPVLLDGLPTEFMSVANAVVVSSIMSRSFRSPHPSRPRTVAINALCLRRFRNTDSQRVRSLVVRHTQCLKRRERHAFQLPEDISNHQRLRTLL